MVMPELMASLLMECICASYKDLRGLRLSLFCMKKRHPHKGYRLKYFMIVPAT